MSSEQISALNQIIAIIDEKASEYKANYLDLPASRKMAEKKMILDLIDDANQLASSIRPAPNDVMGDLKRLGEQLRRLG